MEDIKQLLEKIENYKQATNKLDAFSKQLTELEKDYAEILAETNLNKIVELLADFVNKINEFEKVFLPMLEIYREEEKELEQKALEEHRKLEEYSKGSIYKKDSQKSVATSLWEAVDEIAGIRIFTIDKLASRLQELKKSKKLYELAYKAHRISLNDKNLSKLDLEEYQYDISAFNILKILIESIKHNNVLTEINFTKAYYFKDSVQQKFFIVLLKEMLASHPSITSFIFRSNNLTSEQLAILTPGISQNKNLKIIDLSKNLNFLNQTPARHFKLFMGAIATHRAITTLKLDYALMGDENVGVLAASLAQHPSLEHLSLYANSIYRDGIKFLGDLLKSNQHLRTLDLGNSSLITIESPIENSSAVNEIVASTPRGVAAIEEILEQNQISLSNTANTASAFYKLYDLLLCNLNDIRENLASLHPRGADVIAFAEVLTFNITSIACEHIEILSHYREHVATGAKIRLIDVLNQIGINGTTYPLLEKFFEKVLHTQYLTCSNNLNANFNVNYVGIENFAAALAQNSTLTSLDLRNSIINLKAINILMEGLQTNQSLTAINLQWIKLKDESLNAINEMLKQNHTLRQLDLSYNQITSDGINNYLAPALKQNSTLIELDLSCNKITSKSIGVLLSHINSDCLPRYIDLKFNPIYKIEANEISAIKKKFSVEVFATPEDESLQKFKDINAAERKTYIFVTNKHSIALTELKSDKHQTIERSDEVYVIENDRLDWKQDRASMLGEGGFGAVYRGMWKKTPVAIKVFSLPHENTMTPDERQEINREVQLMWKLNHPHILSLLGICKEPVFGIVLEYMAKGSLFDVLHMRKEELSVILKFQIALGVAKGLQYLHNLTPPVLHRDLKSPNVLLNEEYVPKLSDFGLSKIKSDSQKSVTTRGINALGTIAWMAPELLLEEEDDQPTPSTKAMDIYSCAMIFYELATNQLPFAGIKGPVIMSRLLQGRRPSLKEASNEYALLTGLIEQGWKQEPTGRPDASFFVTEIEKFLVEITNSINRLSNANEVSPLNTEPAAVTSDKSITVSSSSATSMMQWMKASTASSISSTSNEKDPADMSLNPAYISNTKSLGQF